MPRIDSEVKLDFKDVLFRPKRSTLKSRSEVTMTSTLWYGKINKESFYSKFDFYRELFSYKIKSRNSFRFFSLDLNKRTFCKWPVWKNIFCSVRCSSFVGVNLLKSFSGEAKTPTTKALWLFLIRLTWKHRQMPFVDNDVKLDFKDVLFRPKRSRPEISIWRKPVCDHDQRFFYWNNLKIYFD